MGDVIPLIKREFLSFADRELQQLAKSEVALGANSIDAAPILEGANSSINTAYNLRSANIADEPVSQATWVALHDNLAEAMQQKMLNLAFLIKISNFIPDLIRHFGPQYTFLKPTTGGKIHDFSIDLVYYSNPSNVINDITYTTEFVFHYLHGIRQHFSSDTWQELENDPQRDSFATMFLQGHLIEPHDIHSRIEVMFYQKFGIPLGVFPTHDHIQKWIDRSVVKHGMGNSLQRFLSSGTLTTQLPGIFVPELHNASLLTTRIRHDFSTALYGPIPKSGITIGTSHQRPDRIETPRLVYQS